MSEFEVCDLPFLSDKCFKLHRGGRLWEMAEMSKQEEHVDPPGGSRMKDQQTMRATRQKIFPPKHQSTSVTSSGSWPESSKGMSSGPALRRTRFEPLDSELNL
jgi:hypothetical protein